MVEVEVKTSQIKLWVGLSRNILIQIEEANETNLLISPQLAVILLLSKKIKSNTIGT